MGPIGGGLPMGATAHVDWLRMTLIQKQCHFTQNFLLQISLVDLSPNLFGASDDCRRG
jgi:hypothetical protein